MNPLRGCYVWLALTAAIAGAACGKRGAPIAPPVRIPAAIETISAARLGHDVYVTLVVPETNIDQSMPIDITSIDVYGYTGVVAPSRATWAELGEVVGSIPVVPPPVIPGAPTRASSRRPPAAAPAAPAAPPTAAGALPGTPVTIRDTLTIDEFQQGKVAPPDPRRRTLPPLSLPGAPVPTVLRRFYLAIPWSQRARPGPPGAQAELVLGALPDPPADVRLRYTASEMSLSWDPSGGLLGFLLDRGLPPEPIPFVEAPRVGPPVAAQPVVDTAVPPGPTTYNVYRELSPDPLELRPAAGMPPWYAPLPAPINLSPLSTTTATDTVAFDREHCYSVRAQRGMLLSAPSPRTCMTPADIFPPAAPAGLAAVPSEGGISLIWEPNSELDLGGYLVLRREPGDATLRQLTATPIADARYRDANVKPGARYMYSVVAVDSRLPLPNVSTESERVEETAR